MCGKNHVAKIKTCHVSDIMRQMVLLVRLLLHLKHSQCSWNYAPEVYQELRNLALTHACIIPYCLKFPINFLVSICTDLSAPTVIRGRAQGFLKITNVLCSSCCKLKQIIFCFSSIRGERSARVCVREYAHVTNRCQLDEVTAE